jgi:hypothetical protein
MPPCGYHHRNYAFSLSDFGEPILLEKSGGWLLLRTIPGSDYRDAMGCYPLFTCNDWDGLFDDLRNLKEQFVSVCLVTDPFADVDFDKLRRIFQDVCYPFKEHMVVDLSQPAKATISKHHQRYAKKALKHVQIKVIENPASCVDIWSSLYANLIQKKGIQGLTRFSRKSFVGQLEIPGCVVFQALFNQRVIAMHIWYRYQDRAYYHLGASSDEGYRRHGAFGLFWEAIHNFQKEGLQWLHLGGGAGTKFNPDDGLTQFKKGWANTVRPVFFCGAILDRQRYHTLCLTQKNKSNNYFPAYRAGEFI